MCRTLLATKIGREINPVIWDHLARSVIGDYSRGRQLRLTNLKYFVNKVLVLPLAGLRITFATRDITGLSILYPISREMIPETHEVSIFIFA